MNADVLAELRTAAARKWKGAPATQRAGLFARAADKMQRLLDIVAEQQRTIAALMVGMPDDGTTPVIVRIGRLEAEADRLRARLLEMEAAHEDGAGTVQALQEALQEADLLLGHCDEPTEWREKWAHLYGPNVRGKPPEGSA